MFGSEEEFARLIYNTFQKPIFLQTIFKIFKILTDGTEERAFADQLR